MATLLPENLVRLQAYAIASDAELSSIGEATVLRMVAKDLAEKALRKLMNDCVKVERRGGSHGTVVSLDVCIVTQSDLLQMVSDARAEGARDVARWGGRLQPTIRD